MRIIAVKTLKDFWKKQKHKDAEYFLRAWFWEVKREKWKLPHDIKKKYKSASILANNFVVFNVKGNKYRLVVSVKYEFQVIFIRFIGPHEEYDKIDVKNHFSQPLLRKIFR